MTDKKCLELIAVNPKVMRLGVDFVPNLMVHISTFQEIITEYKDLTQADIQACILFTSNDLLVC